MCSTAHHFVVAEQPYSSLISKTVCLIKKFKHYDRKQKKTSLLDYAISCYEFFCSFYSNCRI